MTARGTPRPPTILLALAAIGVVIFAAPLVGLLARTPWSRLGELLASDIVIDALRVSIVSSLIAAVISAIIGVPLAFVLARVPFPGRDAIRAIVTLPMVLPPVVGGAALLFAFGRRGLFGEVIDAGTGLTLPFTLTGVIMANTFVAMPFLVITVEGALRSLDGRHERAAATLGAGEFEIFRRVTLPLIAPSLRAGIVLAWARALGEFGATITFAGNLQGRTQTLPLAVFVTLESDRDAAIAISLVLVALSVVLLVALRDRWWVRS